MAAGPSESGSSSRVKLRVRSASTVTALGTDAPHSVMAITDADDPGSADRLLTSLAIGLANVATNNAVLRGGQAAVAINPDHAALLAANGHDRRSIATAIVERHREFVLGLYALGEE